jgi:cation diffusion facilitator CzcD-associated flavoprotein CzcO
MEAVLESAQKQYDAIVIGAGFAGIYALYKLRHELGLTVRCFEKGSGVGGTWFWNRYPGARTDTETRVYRYSFDKEIYGAWDWRSRFANQPEVLDYLRAIARHYGLDEHISLSTCVKSAVYDEAAKRWVVTTAAGDAYVCRYLLTAVGVLSKLHTPDIPGRERFRGTVVHTANWPEGLEVDGKRIGVVGTGSTGVQLICAAAQRARHVTVFQRNAQYCVPAGDDLVSEQEIADYKDNFDAIWRDIRGTRIACGFRESDVPAMSVPQDERQRVFEENWQLGTGFRFMFGTFADIASNEQANREATRFIEAKIKAIVKDPDTAAKLIPDELYAKRPISINRYYEVYNQANVSLVSLKQTPIAAFTETGVRTADGRVHELDVLAYATGFDTIVGSFKDLEVRGANGLELQAHWKDEATSYMGVATAHFPNFFMVPGPKSVFCNIPPGIEAQLDSIAALIRKAEREAAACIRVAPDAEHAWTETCNAFAAYTLLPKVKSWIFGANIPDGKRQTLFYFGGLNTYRETWAELAKGGFKGFLFEGAHEPVTSEQATQE